MIYSNGRNEGFNSALYVSQSLIDFHQNYLHITEV